MLRSSLARLIDGNSLSFAEAEAVFDQVMSGAVAPSMVAGLLVSLRSKGESAEEVAGAASSLRKAMVRVAVPEGAVVDTCGTGGGMVTTVNISTAAAFVVAGAGVPVAKHGNRSYTSRSGSADVLEALGVPVSVGPERAGPVLRQAGLVFLFAPSYHPAMKHVAPVRKELGVPTIMNLIGPLANPAGVRRQVIGVSRAEDGPLMARALQLLETEDSMVVHAEVGMDEISPSGATRIWRVADGRIEESTIDPEVMGLPATDLAELAGGDPGENAQTITELLDGKGSPAVRTAVLLNAAAALLVAGAASRWPKALGDATAALDGGAARRVLERLRHLSG